MTFEEEFPSFVLHKVMLWDLPGTVEMIEVKDVLEHCLDKQRVKEAIENSEDCYLEIANQEQANIIIRLIRDLREDLGLNK